ncbi:MAG: hypothetical protein LBS27_07695 [Bifidobacteriaceae bacterium]|jgi:hypothetical protein|nr:hypothetical protein [Bifidobacteriaceae bacterium]
MTIPVSPIGAEGLALARAAIKKHIGTYKRYATPPDERLAAAAAISALQAEIAAAKAADPDLAQDNNQFDYWRPIAVAPVFVGVKGAD